MTPSGRISKFLIEKDRMCVENPNKVQNEGRIKSLGSYKNGTWGIVE